MGVLASTARIPDARANEGAYMQTGIDAASESAGSGQTVACVPAVPPELAAGHRPVGRARARLPRPRAVAVQLGRGRRDGGRGDRLRPGHQPRLSPPVVPSQPQGAAVVRARAGRGRAVLPAGAADRLGDDPPPPPPRFRRQRGSAQPARRLLVVALPLADRRRHEDHRGGGDLPPRQGPAPRPFLSPAPAPPDAAAGHLPRPTPPCSSAPACSSGSPATAAGRRAYSSA